MDGNELEYSRVPSSQIASEYVISAAAQSLYDMIKASCNHVAIQFQEIGQTVSVQVIIDKISELCHAGYDVTPTPPTRNSAFEFDSGSGLHTDV